MTDNNTVYLDFADGVKRVMNNATLYVKLLAKFRDDTKLDNLEAALAAGDLAKAQTEAHTIKGVAANLSLSELYRQCLELETRIKAGSASPDQVAAVTTVFNTTLQEIDKVLAENG